MAHSLALQATPEAFSLLSPYGYQSGSCGYCKDPDSSGAYYASSKYLTANHYQKLIDRSWRRSGTLLYKPDQGRSCCPHYTIRLPAEEFHASRDQRQALHRWNKFVLGETYMKETAKLHPKSKEEKKRRQSSFVLAETIHEAEYENLQNPPQPAHHFEVTLENNDFSEEKYTLFEQYQRLVHKEDPSSISRAGFKRFLCESPIPQTTQRMKGFAQRLGSYHQCYRLNGKLIALGVLDLLPQAVSSVYLLYDVEYEKYSFGKLSALREACLAQEDSYQYYYMGFYIHSCTKMRYKNDYKPQYILDPDLNQWEPLDDVYQAELDRKGFVSLARDRHDPRVNIASPDVSAMQPKTVEQSHLSVLEMGLPGTMSKEVLETELHLGSTIIQIGPKASPQRAPANALVSWDNGAIGDPSSVQGIIGDLVACVGPELAREMIVDLGS